jgi:hypothetical protein
MFQDCASDIHWTHLKCVLHYLKTKLNFDLAYNKHRKIYVVIGFVDADRIGDSEQIDSLLYVM